MEHYDHRQHHPDYHEHHLQVRQSWTPPTQFLPSPGPTKAKAGRTFYLLSATLTPKSGYKGDKTDVMDDKLGSLDKQTIL